MIWRILCLCLLATSAQAEGKSFRDDFDVHDRGRWIVSDGWSNGDWMNCTWAKDAVRFEDGTLVLKLEEAPAKPGTYRCGEVQSRALYGFGTYEAMLRTGTGSGVNAAFFTYIGPVHKRPHHEVDIEFLLRDTSRVSLNTYVDGKAMNGKAVALPVRSDQEFLHIAFIWRPESVVWMVNGKELHRTKEGSKIPSEPQKIYASLWSSDTFTEWMGPFDAKNLPQRLSIEWLAFTSLGEPCQFEGSVVCGID